MAKADTSVKWFHSGMANAPILRGEAGALIELLDACLINGFDARTPDSIVVAGGVATVSLSAGNPFEQHVVIQLAGATPAGLNAEWRIATSAASSFTFACPGIAEGTAIGTITCKRAPAGWAKPFSATGKAVYQASDLEATQFYLRLDDADAQGCRVRGYEQMSDVDTGVDPFPTLTQRTATNYTWRKSDESSGVARPWLLVADGMMIYLVCKFDTTVSFGYALHWFGDVVSYFPGDVFHCAIAANGTAIPSFPGHISSAGAPLSAEAEYLARRADPVTKSSVFARFGIDGNSGFPFGGTNMPPLAAGDPMNLLYPMAISDAGSSLASSVPLRGQMPGLAAPLHHKPVGHLSLAEGGGALQDHTLIGVMVAYITASGCLFIDITGPWR